MVVASRELGKLIPNSAEAQRLLKAPAKATYDLVPKMDPGFVTVSFAELALRRHRDSTPLADEHEESR